MKCKSELDTFLPHKSVLPLPSSPDALQILALCSPQAPSLCYGDKRARILGPWTEGTLCSWPPGGHQEHPGTQEFWDGLTKKLPQALSWGRSKQHLILLCIPLTLPGTWETCSPSTTAPPCLPGYFLCARHSARHNTPHPEKLSGLAGNPESNNYLITIVMKKN